MIKIPFMLKRDGEITVHDHETGDLLERYEGLVGDYRGNGDTSFFLFWYEKGERHMAHMGFSVEEAIKELATVAIDEIKRGTK